MLHFSQVSLPCKLHTCSSSFNEILQTKYGQAYVSSTGFKSILVPFDSSHEHTSSFLQVSPDEENAAFKIAKIKSAHSTLLKAISLCRRVRDELWQAKAGSNLFLPSFLERPGEKCLVPGPYVHTERNRHKYPLQPGVTVLCKKKKTKKYVFLHNTFCSIPEWS